MTGCMERHSDELRRPELCLDTAFSGGAFRDQLTIPIGRRILPRRVL